MAETPPAEKHCCQRNSNSNNMGCGGHEDHHFHRHFHCRLRLLLPCFVGLRRPSAPRGQIRADWPCTDPRTPATFNNNWLSAASSQRWLQTPDSLLHPHTSESCSPAGGLQHDRAQSGQQRPLCLFPFGEMFLSQAHWAKLLMFLAGGA